MSGAPSNLDGVLAIWKPAGWTSHDIVAKVRGILRIRRIGHTGTLDPAVTGVLPLCIGRATRFVEYLQEMPKTYEATLRFGVATDTEDLEGNVVDERDASFLDERTIVQAALSFVGEIDQVPPMVSAVKVGGKRLYELARQGVTVERESRRVHIHDIRVLKVDAGGQNPEISFSVTCSKGTYIRTLCVDIGRKLGVPAVMAKLVRTESAGLTRERCVTLERLSELAGQGEVESMVIPADAMLTEWPSSEASYPEAAHALQGKAIDAKRLSPPPEKAGMIKLYRDDGVFLGLFEVGEGARTARPIKVFLPE